YPPRASRAERARRRSRGVEPARAHACQDHAAYQRLQRQPLPPGRSPRVVAVMERPARVGWSLSRTTKLRSHWGVCNPLRSGGAKFPRTGDGPRGLLTPGLGLDVAGLTVAVVQAPAAFFPVVVAEPQHRSVLQPQP